MKRLADLDAFLAGDEPGLELIIGGRVYTVPPPDAATGLWCQRVTVAAGHLRAAATEAEASAAAARIDQIADLDGDLTLPERVLGPAHAAMVAGGVDHARLRIAAMTALLWIVSGDEAAEAYWTSGGRPEALRPADNRAERRASSSTGGAATTKPLASTSGTKPPNTSGGKKRGRRSRGRRS
ncbi:MAG: hypothetical protein JXA67_08130 [Micromonosporaceae bacterium]|nr:hypothetical protein [Micromonosporaceae bacterium]